MGEVVEPFPIKRPSLSEIRVPQIYILTLNIFTQINWNWRKLTLEYTIKRYSSNSGWCLKKTIHVGA